MASLVRFYRYLSRHWVGVIAIFGVSLASALTALPVPLFVRQLIDRALPERDSVLLVLLVAGICVAWLVSHGLMILGAYGAAWLRENVHLAVRQDLFEHLQRQPAGFFEERETGGLVSRLTNDVAAVQGLIGERMFSAAGELVYLVGGILILLSLDWRLALVSLVALPVAMLVFGLLRNRLQNAQRRLQQSQEELSARLFESLAGIRVVQAFGLEARQADKMRRQSQDLKAVQMRKQLVTSIASGMGMMLTLLPIAVVVWGFGGHRVLTGALSLGTLVAFYHYLGTFFRPMSVIFQLITEAVTALAAARRIFDVLDQPPAIRDPEQGVALRDVSGRIEVSGLHFTYNDGSEALREINLKIDAGEVIGLVGPSGAGKTTLAHLMVRFADPTDGSIKLDGHDLRTVKLHDLRHQVALVGQDVFLFNDTVRENLRIARPEVSEQEVERAATMIGADRFIKSLSDGYDTLIGERGTRLSGGQRQLLALGRVVLHDPRVLVFDEATSALDAITEAQLQQALKAILAGRTAVVIAHRWNTLRLVQRLALLDQGRLVAEGTHAELLDSVELYRELTVAQAWDRR